MLLLARTAAMLAAALAVGGPAAAVTLIDGGFEAGAFGGRILRADGVRQVLPAGGDAPSGWLEYGTGTGYVDNGVWAASAGNRSFDLAGLGSGGIVQRISGFTVGRRYRLSFDLSANPFDPAERPFDRRVQVSASGMMPGVFTYRVTDDNTPENMRYQRFSYDFIAGSETQNIGFASRTAGSFGAVLDNVALSAVPEATTWALLIIGFSAVGVMARQRRTLRPVIAA